MPASASAAARSRYGWWAERASADSVGHRTAPARATPSSGVWSQPNSGEVAGPNQVGSAAIAGGEPVESPFPVLCHRLERLTHVDLPPGDEPGEPELDRLG